MTLLAVPNVSEGRDARAIAAFGDSVRAAGGRILDVHSDPVHDRSVLTVGGEPSALTGCMTRLAAVVSVIDLTRHEGVHPRLGALDVCPFVFHDEGPERAIAAAHAAGQSIAGTGLPVYFYGHAARRLETRELRDLRRGGLTALSERARSDLPPDLGPHEIDPHRGVVCVGARPPLIAFNVWLRSSSEIAKGIAARVRSDSVRALGLRIDHEVAQVSLNLVSPAAAGIDAAFARVAAEATRHGVEPIRTEIVGLVPERDLPDPDGQAARLLIEPGRSIESALAD